MSKFVILPPSEIVSTQSWKPPEEGSPYRMVVYRVHSGRLYSVDTLQLWTPPEGWTLEKELEGNAIAVERPQKTEVLE